MSFSFFTENNFTHCQSLPQKVLFLDFDDTISLPARDAEGNYIIEKNGFIDAKFLDKVRLESLLKFVISQNIPVYLITARPNTVENKNLLFSLIKKAAGFSTSGGGFKKDSIYFCSRMINQSGKLIRKEIFSKVDMITKIHTNFFTYLPKHDCLFVDDMDCYLNPVREAGYATIKANPKTLSHFAEIKAHLSVFPAFKKQVLL